jgi:sodium/bile acid cotransporter 7
VTSVIFQKVGAKLKKTRIKIFLIQSAYLIFSIVFFTGSAFADKQLNDKTKQQKVESMYAEYKKSFPEVADVSAEEAIALLENGPVLFVDFREAEEQAVSMLPGAIPDSVFLKNPEVYKDKIIIGYCTISYRSGKLAEKLKKKGLRIINLRGGILAWLHAGGRVYKDNVPVNRVHVYGRKWDLAPTGYKTFY